MLLIRADVGEEALLATQQVEVHAEGGEGGDDKHRERFTFGLDTLATADPPGWLDVVAYGVSLALLGLLLRGLVASLMRLGRRPHRDRSEVATSL